MLSFLAMKDRNDALSRAIKSAGGVSALAARLVSCSPQAVSQWDKIPPLRVLEVERATGISRHELRPDLYPMELAEARP